MTYREIIYMCMDELKLSSDDAQFNEEHILFLISKYRAFLLKQKYSDIKKIIPDSNYQTLCLDLIEVPSMDNDPCSGSYLRSTCKIPFLIKIGIPKVYPTDYFKGEISYISRDRMKYTGYNKYTKNIIYSTIGPDNYLYLKSENPQFLYLEKVRFTGVFEDTKIASELQCPDDCNRDLCDIMDKEFPIESSLVPPMIELVVKELTMPIHTIDDEDNNAKDDLVNTIGNSNG